VLRRLSPLDTKRHKLIICVADLEEEVFSEARS